MSKIKKVFTNTRIIILLVFIVFALFAIRPSLGTDGVAIRSVLKNSSAAIAGIENPKPNINPMAREVISVINNQEIASLEDYENAISDIGPNETVYITTNRDSYMLVTNPIYNVTVLNETEDIEVTREVTVNQTINGTIVPVRQNVTETVTRNKIDREVIGVEDIGLKVFDAPSSNIRKGLDLQGGTRVLMEPERPLSVDEMSMVIEHMKQRLNVYGLSDITVREAGDLPPPLGDGKQFIMVEVAGVNEQEVKDLLAKQGKFEAKIGGDVVFSGGDDITYVCRSSECSGLEPGSCGLLADGTTTMCRFRFSITLSQEAAKRQAEVTEDLGVITTDENGNPLPEDNHYLNETLDFYLDDERVDSLNIAKDLRGNAVTDIQISGSGSGIGEQNAALDALTSMKSMQTVLVTGSLPVKLDIVKVDNISPVLGQKFAKNAILVGLFAILAVTVSVFVRYRSFSVVVPIVMTMGSEVLLLLGMASLIGWNLDLAAVAGIIIAVGTGVDDQIVIADETLGRKKRKEILTWKQKIKRAFFIIFAAYFTTVVAMLPLWFAGAGLLKMFAITTILGVTIGVLITRPAYAALLEILEKDG